VIYARRDPCVASCVLWDSSASFSLEALARSGLSFIHAASFLRMPPSLPRGSQHSHASACDPRDAHRRVANRRRVDFHDAADNGAVRPQIEIIVTPLAGWTRGRCAFEDEIVLVRTVPRGYARGAQTRPKCNSRGNSHERARRASRAADVARDPGEDVGVDVLRLAHARPGASKQRPFAHPHQDGRPLDRCKQRI